MMNHIECKLMMSNNSSQVTSFFGNSTNVFSFAHLNIRGVASSVVSGRKIAGRVRVG